VARTGLQSVYAHLPIPAQELVVFAAGWKSYRERYGAPFRRALRELRETDRLDADAGRAYQERRLREIVRWAARTVPYYRELFREHGIDPDAIRGVDDLRRIPYLEKETVRRRGRDLRSDAIPKRQIIPGHTSGTTGTALELYHTREALGWEYAVIARQREWFGVHLGDRFAAFGGQTVVPIAQQKPPFWRYDRMRARMLFSLYHMKAQNLQHYANELCRPDYRFWQGYPSSIGLICSYLLDRKRELGAAAPRAVFTSSETVLSFHREIIEKATGAPVADRYGNAELSVSALQCPERRYHVDTEFGVVEIDPLEETDEWVRGEVVATGFANRAMPLLRYRTGDLATLYKRETCACGRARPLLEQIDGRIEDYIVTPEGARVGRMDHVFKDALEIAEAQIYQPSVDRVVVRVVPRAGYGRKHEARLELALRQRLGPRIRIEFETSGPIPRLANGKFRAVVSDVAAARVA
jgi:phenylacetate-CoA ligase